MNFGLIGGKLGHSYSPQIHSHLGTYSYVLIEKQPEELEELLLTSDIGYAATSEVIKNFASQKMRIV